jgi:hypothetical protein
MMRALTAKDINRRHREVWGGSNEEEKAKPAAERAVVTVTRAVKRSTHDSNSFLKTNWKGFSPIRSRTTAERKTA